MTAIRFANILLEKNYRAINNPGLYCKADGQLICDTDGTWILADAAAYDFDTYFNSLSVMKLRRYTTATAFTLHLELKGTGISIQQTKGAVFSHAPEKVGEPISVDAPDWKSLDIPLQVDDDAVIVGFTLTTSGPTRIRNSYYSVEVPGSLREVNLALASTTFKKESYILANIDLVKREICQAQDDLARHFHMYVIDNGRTLDPQKINDASVTVIPNENVGGAGGFARGMLAALDQKNPATHVLLMDDDVSVSTESIRRTYNLLRIVKDAYKEALVSGAMLSYLVGDMQSEDTGYMSEDGAFRPAKPPLRLTLFRDVVYNESFKVPKTISHIQRYAAWWYCVIPTSVIKKVGLPLPFFVRCDDAEYGYRCDRPLITMNGLCVWHMPFDVRYNPAVERYQTTRNTLIASFTTGFAPQSDFIYPVRNFVRLELKKFCYPSAELTLDAFEDFLKGPEFIAGRTVARDTFLAANRHKEKTVSFDELDRQAKELGLDFRIEDYSRQIVDADKPRSFFERATDLVTDNGQRFFRTKGKGYVVIPFNGWAYPAGVMRGKRYIIAVDWYNRTGVIREKDVEKFRQIRRRYSRDMAYFRQHEKELRRRYAQAAPELTSFAFWRRYLAMTPVQG